MMPPLGGRSITRVRAFSRKKCATRGSYLVPIAEKLIVKSRSSRSLSRATSVSLLNRPS